MRSNLNTAQIRAAAVDALSRNLADLPQLQSDERSRFSKHKTLYLCFTVHMARFSDKRLLRNIKSVYATRRCSVEQFHVPSNSYFSFQFKYIPMH